MTDDYPGTERQQPQQQQHDTLDEVQELRVKLKQHKKKLKERVAYENERWALEKALRQQLAEQLQAAQEANVQAEQQVVDLRQQLETTLQDSQAAREAEHTAKQQRDAAVANNQQLSQQVQQLMQELLAARQQLTQQQQQTPQQPQFLRQHQQQEQQQQQQQLHALQCVKLRGVDEQQQRRGQLPCIPHDLPAAKRPRLASAYGQHSQQQQQQQQASPTHQQGSVVNQEQHHNGCDNAPRQLQKLDAAPASLEATQCVDSISNRCSYNLLLTVAGLSAQHKHLDPTAAAQILAASVLSGRESVSTLAGWFSAAFTSMAAAQLQAAQLAHLLDSTDQHRTTEQLLLQLGCATWSTASAAAVTAAQQQLAACAIQLDHLLQEHQDRLNHDGAQPHCWLCLASWHCRCAGCADAACVDATSLGRVMHHHASPQAAAKAVAGATRGPCTAAPHEAATSRSKPCCDGSLALLVNSSCSGMTGAACSRHRGGFLDSILSCLVSSITAACAQDTGLSHLWCNMQQQQQTRHSHEQAPGVGASVGPAAAAAIAHIHKAAGDVHGFVALVAGLFWQAQCTIAGMQPTGRASREQPHQQHQQLWTLLPQSHAALACLLSAVSIWPEALQYGTAAQETAAAARAANTRQQQQHASLSAESWLCSCILLHPLQLAIHGSLEGLAELAAGAAAAGTAAPAKGAQGKVDRNQLLQQVSHLGRALQLVLEVVPPPQGGSVLVQGISQPVQVLVPDAVDIVEYGLGMLLQLAHELGSSCTISSSMSKACDAAACCDADSDGKQGTARRVDEGVNATAACSYAAGICRAIKLLTPLLLPLDKLQELSTSLSTIMAAGANKHAEAGTLGQQHIQPLAATAKGGRPESAVLSVVRQLHVHVVHMLQEKAAGQRSLLTASCNGT